MVNSKKVFATRDNVHSACDRIMRDGKMPTFKSVREALGGGSNDTIQKYMSEWKEANGEELAGLNSESIQIPVGSARKPVEDGFLQMYQVIYSIVDTQIKDERIRILDSEIEALKDEIEMLQSQLSEVEKENIRLKTIEEFYKQQMHQNQELAIENSKLKDEIAKLKQSKSKLAKSV